MKTQQNYTGAYNIPAMRGTLGEAIDKKPNPTRQRQPKRSDMEAALRDYDRQVTTLTAQRDELLAAGQKAFRAMEEAIRSLPIGHEVIKELEAARSAIAKCEAQP